MKEKKIIEMIQQNELNKARSELIKKLKRSPVNIDLLNLLGMVQIKLGFITEAIESFKKSILINPKKDDTLNNLISAYQEIDDISAAIEIIERNIHHCDDGIIFKLAYFYNKKNKFDKAIDSYKKLESSKIIDPKTFLYNLAISYENNLQLEKAVDTYKRCLQLDQDFFEARFNLSILYLYTNNFELGWKYFQARLDFKQNKIGSKIPILENHKVINKNILIIFEYGIGDQILFSSFLESLDLTKNKYIIKIDSRLQNIIKNKYPDICIYDESDNKKIDYIVPIGSLGQILRPSIDSFKNVNHYVKPNIENVRSIKQRLPKDRIYCGISWKSSNKELGKFKSINFEKILKNIKIKNICFINLQYKTTENEILKMRESVEKDIIDFEYDLFNDIEKLTELIAACDFVITISNVTAHLAGLIKKPTMVIPPKIHGKLWYWGNQIDGKSIWYENVSIIENMIQTTEEEIIDQINNNLDNYQLRTK